MWFLQVAQIMLCTCSCIWSHPLITHRYYPWFSGEILIFINGLLPLAYGILWPILVGILCSEAALNLVLSLYMLSADRVAYNDPNVVKFWVIQIFWYCVVSC